MAKLFTKEQARTWLRENNLRDGKSIERVKKIWLGYRLEKQNHPNSG